MLLYFLSASAALRSPVQSRLQKFNPITLFDLLTRSSAMRLFVALCFASGFVDVMAQGELPVDMYTGRAGISIPIYSVASSGVAENISLSYDAGGVKVAAPTGSFGVNWNVQVGGYIKRTVRGIPDDYQRTGGTPLTGWLYLNGSGTRVAADIATFANSSNTDFGLVCSDESADAAKLTSWSGGIDTEPDIFSYSVGGYSGKFVFDNSTNPQIRLIPYQDISIVPQFVSATDRRITSFTVTTNDGNVYTIDILAGESRWVETIATQNEAFKTFRNNYYDMGPPWNIPAYTAGWYLRHVVSPSDGKIEYLWQAESNSSNDTLSIKVKKRSSNTYAVEPVYIDHLQSTAMEILQVKSADGSIVTFDRTNGVVTRIEIRDNRDNDNNSSTSAFVKEYILKYSSSHGGTSRQNLISFRERSGTDSIPAYKFSYYGAPPDTRASQDYWGYFNGGPFDNDGFPKLFVYPALPSHERVRLYEIPGYVGDTVVLAGVDRRVDTTYVKYGSLYTIQYPWGGNTTIKYEANTYFDPVANLSYPGGGIRIKSATYEDGTNPAARIEKKLFYTDGTGKSSGVLITKPSFVVPLFKHKSTSGDLNFLPDDELNWVNYKQFLARTTEDLSSADDTHGNTVGYKEVRVVRPGSGYVQFFFDVPAGWGDGATGLWIPTINKLARGTCDTGGVLQMLGTAMYPYAPHPDYDYQRGLVTLKREFNEAGHKVRETATTYQDIFRLGASAPLTVSAVRYDKYANSNYANNLFLFGKYYFLTDAARVVSTESVTTYDPNDVTKFGTEQQQFYFTSTNHRFISDTKSTTIDGTSYYTHYRYPQDFGTISGTTDKASEMIKNLQTANRVSAPVERIVTVQKPGGNENVVGAAIMKFNDFLTPGKILPESALQWVNSNTVSYSSFIKAYVNTSGGTGVFTIDPNYKLIQTFLAYDTADNLSLSIGEDSVLTATLWSSRINLPVASIVSASVPQIAFSDFDVPTEASFTPEYTGTDGGLWRGPGRAGDYAMGFYETRFVKALKKSGNYYVLTGWWNKNVTSIGVSVTLKNSPRTATYSTHSFTVNPSAQGTWDFFRLKVPLNAVSTQDYYIEVVITPNSTPTAACLLDDLAFYPETAVLKTSTFKIPFGTTSETVGNKTSFTVFDNLGRVKYVLDQDKNIIQRNTYQFSESN